MGTENRMYKSPVAAVGHALQGQDGRATESNEEMVNCVLDSGHGETVWPPLKKLVFF